MYVSMRIQEDNMPQTRLVLWCKGYKDIDYEAKTRFHPLAT